MAGATESLAVRRRREARREEWTEQTKLAALLPRYLPDGAFWSAVENSPRSALSGMLQKRRGCRAGMPDIVVLHVGRLVCVELKSRRGVPSAAQREVAAAIQAAGGRWWVARSARAALVALHLSDIPLRRGWRAPQLKPWEGPTENPRARLPSHPAVLAERRAATARWRARQRAREIARLAEPSILGARDPRGADARA